MLRVTDTGAKVGVLGMFLRHARANVNPHDVGLTGGGQRRTPGLRREEVALLAGVSQTYYTYLEQGRPVRPSIQVLDGLARALLLDPSQHAYLVALVHPGERPLSLDDSCGIAPDLARLLDAVGCCPAWVTNRRRDVLAANRAGRALLMDWATLPARERNIVYWVFLHPGARQVLVDWEQIAHTVLARLRAKMARHPDPGVDSFLDQVFESCPQARSWWNDHRVLDGLPDVMRFRGPDGKIISTRPAGVRPVGPSDQELMIQTPLPGSNTHELLRQLELRVPADPSPGVA